MENMLMRMLDFSGKRDKAGHRIASSCHLTKDAGAERRAVQRFRPKVLHRSRQATQATPGARHVSSCT
jgi:hypothetical protein